MTAPIHQGRDPSDDERANRVQSLASVLEALATHLSGVERRRKSLLLFSEGIDYNTGDLAGSFTTRVQRHAPAVVEALERGIAALVRASVAMYTIDPRGLGSGEGDLLELPIHEVPVASLDNPGVRGEYTNSIDSLRHLAEATGGFAAVDRNEFTGAFDRIMRESSEYYVLGYVPTKSPKPGEARRIEVRVTRPDVRIVARKVYAAPKQVVRAPAAGAFGDASAMPDARNRGGRTRGLDTLSGSEPAPSATRGLPSELGTLLASPLPRAGLPLRVHAVPYKGDGRRHVVSLVIEMAGNALAFVERDQKFDERIRLALLTVDDRGRAGNGTSTTLDLRLTREELDRVKVTGVRWLSQLSLPPGRHQVRVAARAERTGTSGLATLDIDVPRFERDRLSLSGIALTSLPAALMLTRGEARVPSKLPGPPATARTFVAGDRLTSVVEVYIPPAATADVDVSARVERRDGASAGAATQRGAQRVPRVAGRDRREEVAFAIDAGSLAPGGYLLRIAAQQAGSAERVERTVPFEIIRK